MTNKPSPAQSDIDHQQPCARLVQFTDLHWVTDEHVEQRGMNTRDSFERVTAAAQPMVERADAVLLTGDIAHDELPTTYQALKPNLLALNTPVWALPGNHDLPDAMAREFSEAPFGYLSHYELDNWLVVLLDSHWSGTAKGRLGKTEVQRLAQTVADSTAEHVLVALHHHPLALQSAWLDQVALEDADDLLRVLTADSRHRASMARLSIHKFSICA